MGAAATLVLGVFIGSAIWWLTLSTVVGIFRARFAAPQLLWVNRISGAIILAFGVVAWVSVVRV
jgi:arginine exporter protein ArgO